MVEWYCVTALPGTKHRDFSGDRLSGFKNDCDVC